MKNDKLSPLKWLPVAVVFVFAVVIVVLLVNNMYTTNNFSVITYTGPGKCSNISKNFYDYNSGSAGINTKAILGEKGDLLLLDNYWYYPASTVDSIDLNTEPGDSLVYINGQLNTVIISDEVDLRLWFKHMKNDDLLNLQTLQIDTKIPVDYFPYLTKIAGINPHVSLVFNDEPNQDSTGNDFSALAKLFSPRLLVMDIRETQFNLLSGFKDLACVYLALSDSVVTMPLPALPSLKQCILIGKESYRENALCEDFLKLNPQIERLTLFSINRLSVIHPLKHLTRLSILSTDSLDISHTLDKETNSLKELTVLNLTQTFCSNTSSINTLKNIRWLGLPQNTSQQDFDGIVQQHPKLQVLEMAETDSVKSLEKLKQLTDLRGLVIADSIFDNKTLYSLKQLKFLSLPEESFEDSTNIQSLQKALPGCLIVPNAGACLGSGWLLMILPLIICFALIMRIISKKSALLLASNNNS